MKQIQKLKTWKYFLIIKNQQMKKFNLHGVIIEMAIIFSLASCNKNQDKTIPSTVVPNRVTDEMISENGVNPDEASITQNISATANEDRNFDSNNSHHYLYTESNESSSNKILVYQINKNGSLQWSSSAISGGAGTGTGLGSQGGLALSADHSWLFAVNAGSNSVSSFRVKKDGNLSLIATKNTWGKVPVSVAVHGNMLYVLNHGSDNIHGFWIGNDGMLTDINNSTKPLSGSGVDAPQISFTPDGNFLVVPEKATNIIGTFKMMGNGSPASGIFNPSVGNTPYGFGFSRNYLVISNAEMGGSGAGSGTSYIVQSNGHLKDINGARPDYQSAPCWVAITAYGRFAYMTNAASNNISSYYIAPWGGLYLVESNAGVTGTGPVDIAVAENNYFVYALNSGTHNISCFYRMFFGKLGSLGTMENLPTPSTGLVTF